MQPEHAGIEGLIFDVDSFAVHDGPGIRLSVYVKGCPLSCRWCHSPESRRPGPELIFLADRCRLCGQCAAACPHGVHRILRKTPNGLPALEPDGALEGLAAVGPDGASEVATAVQHLLNRQQCVLCGQCIRQCPRGALDVRGYVTTAGQIVERAVRLKPFFDHSGGGITLTGGEVTAQPAFCAAMLKGCRQEGINTAIQTSGYCLWSDLETLLGQADLVMYDIKLIDDQQHRQWTGRSNRPILENAARLAGRNVQVRVPLIPGITDTAGNIRGICQYVRQAGLRQVCLLPYNGSSAAKYEWLGLPYDIAGQPQSPEQLAALADIVRAEGLDVTLS
jgi:pyruvate formate lyase activating enzyme